MFNNENLKFIKSLLEIELNKNKEYLKIVATTPEFSEQVNKLSDKYNEILNVIKEYSRPQYKKFSQISPELRKSLERCGSDEEIAKLGFSCVGTLSKYEGFEDFFEKLWVWVKTEGEYFFIIITCDLGNGYCTLAYTDMFVPQVAHDVSTTVDFVICDNCGKKVWAKDRHEIIDPEDYDIPKAMKVCQDCYWKLADLRVDEDDENNEDGL